MYFYFYDKFVQDKQHDAAIAAVESRLIELGINGRVEKLSIFKNVQELVRDAVKKGATTVVAVGNDATFTTVANIVVDHEVTLGYIPVVDGSRFAQVLGIPTGAGACDVLSKRLCETIDVGKVRDHYFTGCLRVLNPRGVTLRCDDQYTISTAGHWTDFCYVSCFQLWRLSLQIQSPDKRGSAFDYFNWCCFPGFFHTKHTSDFSSR